MCGVGRLPQYAILELQKLSTIRRFIAFKTPESNGGQVISVTVRFKKFLNAFSNPVSYFETKSPRRVIACYTAVWGFPHLESLILTSRYHLSSCFNQQLKSRWYPLPFCRLNAGLEVTVMEPDGLLFLPAFSCTPGAILGTVGAGDKSSPTYRTAACGANAVQERRFQRRVIGQYRVPEPFAEQSAGMPLWADAAERVVKEKAGPAVKVAAPFPNQRPHLTQLRPGEPRQLIHCQTPA